MLRWILPLVAAFAIGPPAAADGPVVTKRAYRAAHQLPPGLPRAHYKYRTTIAAPTYSRGVAIVEEPELLFTPSSNVVPYIPPLVGTPLLPGSSTLPELLGPELCRLYRTCKRQELAALAEVVPPAEHAAYLATV